MAARTILCASLVVVVAVFHGANADSGSTSRELAFQEKIKTAADVIERTPILKAQYESQVGAQLLQATSTSAFPCDVSFGRSATRPTSVHKLRPGDIDVIGAFGDSVSAGNGIDATTLPQVALENRGAVWSIGGDDSLDQGVTTLPNILRKFNPNLVGYAVGKARRDNLKKSALNVAKPGAISQDLPGQARILVERIKSDGRYNSEESWKLITMFIGGNDLCAVCSEPGHSPDDYYNNYVEALSILKQFLVRTIVNVVPMFDVTPLPDLGDRLVCPTIQNYFCSCVLNATTKLTLRPIQMEYFTRLESIANDTRFKRDDFTVVLQPHLRDMIPPQDPVTGENLKFVGPDCFHPNRDAHKLFASWMWNTVLTPLSEKPFSYNNTDVNPSLKCPTKEHPFIFTDGDNTDSDLDNGSPGKQSQQNVLLLLVMIVITAIMSMS